MVHTGARRDETAACQAEAPARAPGNAACAAVAMDPPARSMLGIRELLQRLESCAEADYFAPATDDSQAGRKGGVNAPGAQAAPRPNEEALPDRAFAPRRPGRTGR